MGKWSPKNSTTFAPVLDLKAALYVDPAPNTNWVALRYPMNPSHEWQEWMGRGTPSYFGAAMPTDAIYAAADLLAQQAKAAQVVLADHIAILENVGFQVDFERYFNPYKAEKRSGALQDTYWPSVQCFRLYVEAVHADAVLISDLLNHDDSEVRDAVTDGVIEFRHPVTVGMYRFGETNPADMGNGPLLTGYYRRAFNGFNVNMPIGVSDLSLKRMLAIEPEENGVKRLRGEAVSALIARSSITSSSYLEEQSTATPLTQFDLIRQAGYFSDKDLATVQAAQDAYWNSVFAAKKSAGLFGTAGQLLVANANRAAEVLKPFFEFERIALKVFKAIGAAGIAVVVAIAAPAVSGQIASLLGGGSTAEAVGTAAVSVATGKPGGALSAAAPIASSLVPDAFKPSGGTLDMFQIGGFNVNLGGIINDTGISPPAVEDVLPSEISDVLSSILGNVSIAQDPAKTQTNAPPIPNGTKAAIAGGTGIVMLAAIAATAYFIFEG